VRDRRFWTLSLGAFPVLFLVLVAWPLFFRPGVGVGPLLFLGVALEAVLLWRFADPAITQADTRARRVGLGVLLSVVTGLLVGSALFLALLIAAFGSHG
jgi:hypothetical protein